MTSFSQRFNQWLVEQGKEPVSVEEAGTLDKAAITTAEWMKDHKEEIVESTRQLMVDIIAGHSVDVEARAKALVEKTSEGVQDGRA